MAILYGFMPLGTVFGQSFGRSAAVGHKLDFSGNGTTLFLTVQPINFSVFDTKNAKNGKKR